MNNHEAAKALFEDGKKIRKTCNGERTYITLSAYGNVVTENGCYAAFSADCKCQEWVLYEEPWLNVGDGIYSARTGEMYEVKWTDGEHAIAKTNDGHAITFNKANGINSVFEIRPAQEKKQ